MSKKIRRDTQIFVVPICRCASKALNQITSYRSPEIVVHGMGGISTARHISHKELKKLIAESKNPRAPFRFEAYYRDGDRGPVWRMRELCWLRKDARKRLAC